MYERHMLWRLTVVAFVSFLTFAIAECSRFRMWADLLLVPLVAVSLASIMCCGKKKKKSSKGKGKKKSKTSSAKSDEKPEEKKEPAAPSKDAYDPQYQTLTGVTSDKVFGPVEKNEPPSFSYETQSSKEAEERRKQEQLGTNQGNGEKMHSYDPHFPFEQANIANGQHSAEESRKMETAKFEQPWSTSEKNVPKTPFAPTPHPHQQGTHPGKMQWTHPQGTHVPPNHMPAQAGAPRSPPPQPDQASPYAPKSPYVSTPAAAQPKPPFAPTPQQPVQPSPWKTPYTPAPKPAHPEAQIRGPLHQTPPARPQESLPVPPSRFPVQPQFGARPYMYTPPTAPVQLGAEPPVFPLIQNPQIRPSRPRPPQYHP